jgi:hypothetical protein
LCIYAFVYVTLRTKNGYIAQNITEKEKEGEGEDEDEEQYR